jgi:hypothetical protein
MGMPIYCRPAPLNFLALGGRAYVPFLPLGGFTPLQSMSPSDRVVMLDQVEWPQSHHPDRTGRLRRQRADPSDFVP